MVIRGLLCMLSRDLQAGMPQGRNCSWGKREDKEEGERGRAGNSGLGVMEELQAERGADMLMLLHMGSPGWLLGLV